MNKSVRKKFKNLLPQELFSAVEDIEKKAANFDKKKAVFDLDDTLLVGDIGDALFARLKDSEVKKSIKVDGTKINLSWNEYRNLVSTGDYDKAYRDVVKAMSGIPVKAVRDMTRELIYNDFRYITIEDERVPIPYIYPDMATLIQFLKALDYEIYVISASNAVSVQVICREFLGLTPANSIGIRSKLNKFEDEDYIFTNELIEPIPIGEGKASIYREISGDINPLIVGGNSLSDVPMMKLVDDEGMIFWVDGSEAAFNKFISLIGKDEKKFLRIQRS